MTHSEGQQSECSSKESGECKVMFGKHIKSSKSTKDEHPNLMRYTKSSKRSINRFNKRGKITRCYTCDSIRHWSDRCPHRKHFNPTTNHHKTKSKITLQKHKKYSQPTDELLNRTHLSFLSEKLSLIEEYTTIVAKDISHMQYPKELLHDIQAIFKEQNNTKKRRRSQ